MERVKTLYAALRALLTLTLVQGASPYARAQAPDPEQESWDRAVREGTPEAFQRYLDDYPLGRHASEAFRELISRSLGVEPAAGPRAGANRTPDLY